MKRKIKFAIKSRKGIRKINQDCLMTAFNNEGNFLAIICDGIGSVKGSEYASKLVCDVFANEFAITHYFENVTAWFKNTLQLCLSKLGDLSKEKNLKGISTTLAVLIIIGDKYYVYNIGDSRIYGFVNGQIKQHSYDHNYINYLKSKGVSEEELLKHEAKWYSLTNFVDADYPQLARFNANGGTLDKKQYFLLCTDGIYDYLDDKMLANIVTKTLPLPLKSLLLNSKALKRKSTDNVSNIIVLVE